MLPMLPIVIESAAKALGVVIPLLISIAPFALPTFVQKIDENHRRRLLSATKAAVLVIGEVAARTPTKLDDTIVDVLKMVEKELGRNLRPSESRLVRSMALSLHSDPRFPARLAPTLSVVEKG